jgi:hypothetical protein
MTIESRLVDRATVFQRGGLVEDDYGNLRPSTDAGVTYKGLFQSRSSQEVTLGGEVYTSDWVLYLPPSARIDANDKVRRDADGTLFEVIGAPIPRANGRGRTQLLELSLRHTVG